MVRSYVHLVNTPINIINGKIYNVGFENHTVNKLANMVKLSVGNDVEIETKPTNDMRSYHISSKKLLQKLVLQQNLQSKTQLTFSLRNEK